MESFNEQELLNGAKEFDMDALTAIYDTLSPAIYSYSRRLLGSASLSEECVAETFSRFLHTLKKGLGPTQHLRAYIYRIAHNWVTDYYRRNQPDQPGDEALELIEDHADNPGSAEQNPSKEEIRFVLVNLPEQQRQVIILRYLEGWDFGEIASSLGKSVNAIKVIQHRAVRAMRKQFSIKDE
jgi:RNA polymerase sigma-70 factor (ECF subfamily)